LCISGSHFHISSRHTNLSELGQITNKGQSSLKQYEIARAYTVLPTPISSPSKNLPLFFNPNITPSF